MAAGQAAAAPVFEIIERKSEIDSLSEEGVKPNELKGCLTLNNINFTYPTRPEEQVLHDFSLTIEPKETVALVGASGCGKSTVMQLLERFYDPQDGSVSLDGVNIKDINIQWLRSQIAVSIRSKQGEVCLFMFGFVAASEPDASVVPHQHLRQHCAGCR